MLKLKIYNYYVLKLFKENIMKKLLVVSALACLGV
ncbi:cytochrome c, partial [Campylobacter coli]|nr:cytochrome c [Campylobacter coli]